MNKLINSVFLIALIVLSVAVGGFIERGNTEVAASLGLWIFLIATVVIFITED